MAPTTSPLGDGVSDAQLGVSETLSSKQVRIVQPAEYKQAALTLAEAFRHDKVAFYYIDTPDREHLSPEAKWKIHVDFMEAITLSHCLKGLVTTTGDDYGAVALWIPPNKTIDDVWTIYQSSIWKIPFKLSWEGIRRLFFEFIPLMEKTKAAILGDRNKNSWYLMYIGTRPEARGQGCARRLIEHVTKMADEERVPCYLESSNAVNIIIYQKLGFEPVKKIELTRGDKAIEMDIMVREPESS